MSKQASHISDFEQARAVILNETDCVTGEEHEKMLCFLLHEGECDAEITAAAFQIRYSWLLNTIPRPYVPQLAAGTLKKLMDLGGIKKVSNEARFSVGPGLTGIGRHAFRFEKKWVIIASSPEHIIVQVRNNPKDFYKPLNRAIMSAWCPKCRQELRTPFAKQCLHCGYDWH